MSTLSAIVGQRFAFAHGRTGVLQQSLLSQSDIDRLLGSHDRREAEQILTELKFTKLIDQSLRDADEILLACGKWVQREVASMCPKDKRFIFDILWLEGDLPLLSYLLKKQKGLTSAISTEPTPPVQAYDREDLMRLVEEGTAENLPEELVLFVQSMRSDDVQDPRMIDVRVSQFGADMRARFAKRSGSPLIRTYVRHLVDVQNIRTALRFPADVRNEAADHLLSGGTINPRKLLGVNSSIAAQARIAGLYALADAIDRSPTDTGLLERLLSDVLADDIAAMWNSILGVEPLFAFAVTTLAQIRLLRAVSIGKRNALGPQEIKQMLPPFLHASHYAS